MSEIHSEPSFFFFFLELLRSLFFYYSWQIPVMCYFSEKFRFLFLYYKDAQIEIFTLKGIRWVFFFPAED